MNKIIQKYQTTETFSLSIYNGQGYGYILDQNGDILLRSVKMMTANAFVDDVREAIESGMDAHVAKPIQTDNLRAAIQQALDRKSEQNND